jgi:DNA-binding NtrC family response regulator
VTGDREEPCEPGAGSTAAAQGPERARRAGIKLAEPHPPSRQDHAASDQDGGLLPILETKASIGFNIYETARRLSMHRRTLARKLEKQRVG